MSLEALLDELMVPPGLPEKHVREPLKPASNKAGSPGSPGSPGNTSTLEKPGTVPKVELLEALATTCQDLPITPAEIQDRLKQNKSSLLSLLRLPAQSELYGLTFDDLEEVAGDQWPEVRDDPKQLQAFAHMVATRRMRERGEVPQHYTTIIVCDGCGPIWYWPGAPERVQACLWCFNRIAGRPVPRPAT